MSLGTSRDQLAKVPLKEGTAGHLQASRFSRTVKGKLTNFPAFRRLPVNSLTRRKPGFEE
jgi:hypothetical protein